MHTIRVIQANSCFMLRADVGAPVTGAMIRAKFPEVTYAIDYRTFDGDTACQMQISIEHAKKYRLEHGMTFEV